MYATRILIESTTTTQSNIAYINSSGQLCDERAQATPTSNTAPARCSAETADGAGRTGRGGASGASGADGADR